KMIEAHGGRDPEEPSLDGGAVLEVVRTLDGARDRLLAQVVSLRAPPRHAVAVPPQALAAPLDGGQHGHGAFLPHLRQQGRSAGAGGYGLGFPRASPVSTRAPRYAARPRSRAFPARRESVGRQFLSSASRKRG